MYKNLAARLPGRKNSILVNERGDMARISGNMKDLGADSIQQMIGSIDRWIAANLDTANYSFTQTGTGIMADRNAEYVRRDLMYGLGLAIGIVSILMALLYRHLAMLIIALVPNLIPLLVSGAVLGFAGIKLEASITIAFAVVFGIAVDDIIHFLSKYKISRQQGLGLEESLRQTFVETGKAIGLTSLVLFFGFWVLLFSIHLPSQAIGLLICVTLLSALVCDLFLIPSMLRFFSSSESD